MLSLRLNDLINVVEPENDVQTEREVSFNCIIIPHKKE